jgi:hypothetical protein
MAKAPSFGWETLHRHPTQHSFEGEGFKVRARKHRDNLWLNVQLPSGTWTYLVVDERGAVLARGAARTKRECHERTTAAARIMP